MKKTIFFLSAVIVSITNAFAVVTWDGATKTAWTQGSGTSASPYIISSPNHLAYLAQRVNAGNSYSGKYFKQTEDFDLQSQKWIPIGSTTTKFAGIYDGGGKYVSNVKSASLFGQINNATIQNITIRGAEINYYSSLVSTTSGTCKLINCHNKSNLKKLRCGGLVYTASGTKLELVSCSNSGTLYSGVESGTSLFGGLICSVQCTLIIDKCSSTGGFSLWHNNATSGGFIGEVRGSGNCTIQRSYSTSKCTDDDGRNGSHKNFISQVDSYYSGTIVIKGCYAKGTSKICVSNTINMTSCYVVVKQAFSSGNTFNNASYCFYCNESGSASITNGTLMQSNAMKQTSFLPQINVGEQYFAMDVNNINEGYPILLWQQPNYTITWKNWDGITLATTSVAQGATPSYTGATPTRPSTAEYAYTFSGWAPAITAATANKTYTATYTATPRYTITFNANGGLIPTGGNMGNTPSGHITTLSTDRTSGTVVVTKDKSHFQTMTNDCPSREGYTFAGWYTDPTSGVQVYDNTGYRVVGTYWNSEGNWIGTSNVTLYAHWTPIPYTITVNSSNVSQGTAAGGGTYDYGTNHQITATPSECYRFVQWSDGNTDNPRTIIVKGDATYTAEFSSVQYTIKVKSADEIQGTVGVELVSTVGKENDRIYYTSSDGNIVTPYSATVFGANIVSNTYQDGQGVMIFDRPVVGIGEEAFWNCDSLTSITIPNSVTSIGDFAFGDCESLTSVTIPNSVKSIGEDAFYYCSSLTSITIPNSVASIGRRAFYECFSLSSVTIPNSVTIIREAAFGVCLSLTSITIPNSVTIIEYEAFISCISLTSITIPNSVTSIDINAFGFCDSLTSINVADDNPNYCSMDGVLFSKDRTTLILCPDGTQGAYTIPNSVTSIGEAAFVGCSSLISVTIPNSVTSIGYRAFTRCSSLTSITIPNSVTSIGDLAFGDCESLTAIIVDSNNPNYCSVDGVLFNKDQTTLIQNPIGNTRSEYTIPNSVTSIGYEAFYKCSSLTSVTIPNSVTSIESHAFYGCKSLTSITIPNSLTSIGSYAFESCSSLTSVTFEGLTPPIIGARVFNDINNYPIYVPYGTKDAYVAALNVNNTVYASRVIEK